VAMRTLLLGMAIITAAACSDDNNNNNDDEARALDQGNARGNDLAAQARADFQGTADRDTIAKAAGIVTTLNAGEIAQANLVLSNTDNSDVSDLASEILADHQDNDAKLRLLVQGLGDAPADSSVSLALKTEAAGSMATLQADSDANKDSDLDFDYAQMQVLMHQEASVLVSNVRDYVNDPAMRDFLSSTVDAINKHRDHAGDVLNNL
jgi:predicted outer membrane protein